MKTYDTVQFDSVNWQWVAADLSVNRTAVQQSIQDKAPLKLHSCWLTIPHWLLHRRNNFMVSSSRRAR